MLQKSFSLHQFRLTKYSFLVHSTTRNVPYEYPRLDSILELCRPIQIEQTLMRYATFCVFISEGLHSVSYYRFLYPTNDSHMRSFPVLLMAYGIIKAIFIPRHTLVSGYYVIPLGVCPSVRPSVRAHNFRSVT